MHVGIYIIICCIINTYFTVVDFIKITNNMIFVFFFFYSQILLVPDNVGLFHYTHTYTSVLLGRNMEQFLVRSRFVTVHALAQRNLVGQQRRSRVGRKTVR